MRGGEWDRAEEWFHRLAPLEPEERTRLLTEVTTEDPALAAEIESLLAAHDSEGAFDRLAERIAPAPLESEGSNVGDGGDLTGRTLDHYRVLELVGRGGMGDVYRARDERLGREVALKFLPPWLSRDPSARDRFLVEARIVSAIDHPNVCSLLEMGETGGRFFLIMPFYEGETLKRRLARGPLPVAEAIDVALQTARGLAAAHERGIVHRDVKPDNLLLTEDGTVKILDFGVAKLADVSLTREGQTPGTLHYMAPEQAVGGVVDHRADLWSLGVVLYEMLTGCRPFPSDRPPASNGSLEEGTLDSLSEAPIEDPESLKAILGHLIAPRADRYSDAGKVVDDLADLGSSQGEGRLPVRRSRDRPHWKTRLPVMTARRVGLVVVVTSAVATIGFFGSRYGAESSDVLPPEPARLAVLPFEVRGDGLDVWREGMVDVLSANLDVFSEIRTVPSRTVLARWRQEAGRDPANIAGLLDIVRATGARYGVTGTVVGTEDRLRVRAELFDVRTGSRIGEAAAEGATDSIFTVVDRLSVRLMEPLVTSRSGDRQWARLASTLTSSPVALREYLAGEASLRRGNYQPAIVAFERAIEADSTFALSYYRLAETYMWTTSGVESHEPARLAARYAGRLPEREALLVKSMYLWSTGLPSEWTAPLREAIRKHPDDAEAWYWLGEAYYHVGHELLVQPWEFVGLFERAIELDPSFAPAYEHLIDAAFLQDDSARAAELIDRRNRIGEGVTLEQRMAAYQLAFDSPPPAKIRVILRDFSAHDLRGLATHQLAHPRLLGLRESVLQIGLERPNPRERAIKSWLFWTVLGQGHVEKAIALTEEPILEGDRATILYEASALGYPIPEDVLALAIDDSRTGHGDGVDRAAIFEQGARAAERGDWIAHAAAKAELRALIPTAGSEKVRETLHLQGLVQALDGYAAWRRGDEDRALDHLREAHTSTSAGNHLFRTIWPERNQIIRIWLGGLLLDMERSREALVYYESLGPGWPIGQDPMAYFNVGRLRDRLGDAEGARNAYGLAALAWRDADSRMQPLLKVAQEEADRLGSEVSD